MFCGQRTGAGTDHPQDCWKYTSRITPAHERYLKQQLMQLAMERHMTNKENK